MIRILLLLLLAACIGPPRSNDQQLFAPADLPAVPREFRAVWIATVANIDWPSRSGLPAAVQQDEMLTLLDRCVELNLNAVVLQVRPHGDALYPSQREPWSAYLSGKQGVPPEPNYDPLRFAIDAAHARGLELHAWFNPFRASHPADKSPVSPDHLASRHPEVVQTYGEYLWMEPTADLVQQHSLEVILDVVRRYDVDGVHLDDYFYPYPVKAADGRGELPFPDDRSWAAYQQQGGSLDRNAWRRAAVDRFIESLYREVKAIRPHARVGISPFGIWRPDHPRGIQGFDAFDKIYADSRRWLQEGWVDYLAPQLYWPREPQAQSYPALLQWWQEQSTLGRPIWPGLAPYRANPSRAKPFSRTEVVEQVRLTRSTSPWAPGTLLFSAKVVRDDLWGQGAALRELVFEEQALPPELTSWGAAVPRRPAAVAADATITPESSRSDAARILWVSATPESLRGARQWVVQYWDLGRWHHLVLPTTKRVARIPLRAAVQGPERRNPVVVFATADGSLAGPTTTVAVRVLDP